MRQASSIPVIVGLEQQDIAGLLWVKKQGKGPFRVLTVLAWEWVKYPCPKAHQMGCGAASLCCGMAVASPCPGTQQGVCTSDPDPLPLFLHSGPCWRGNKQDTWIREGKARSWDVGAEELVVKNMFQGGGTTGEPTCHTLSTHSVVVDFRTQV